MQSKSLLACYLCVLAGCAESFPEPFVTDRGVYSEFLDPGVVSDQLADLEASETALYLAIRSQAIGSTELRDVLLSARRRRVPVRAWLLLADEDGYWPGEDNLDAFGAAVTELLAWNESEDLGLEWIVVDMEPPLETSNELVAALEGGNLADAVPILMANRDMDEHLAARQAWADAVDGWHARGLSVGVVGLPYVLDDYGDDDADIQDMFESPIDGIDWDEVGFLVYQNLYQDADGARLGPDLVHDYATTARAQFGDRAAIALGVIGTVGKNTQTTGYDHVDQLAADVDAAAAADIERIHMFSLDGLVELGATHPWLSTAPGQPAVPDPNPEVEGTRDLISTLDRI